MIQGICGQTFIASSVPVGPLLSWESRLRERLASIGSTESPLIWEERATPAGRSISRLRPWTPPTSASGSIGSRWPTAQATDGNKGSLGPRPHDTGIALPQMISATCGRWPTPTVADVEGGRKHRSGARRGELLLNGLMAPPASASPRVTPSARDWKDSAGMATERPDGRSRIDQLPRQMAAAWSTPRASDGEKGGPNMSFGAGGTPLPTQLHRNAPTGASGPAPNGSPATTGKRGAPNPAFTFWLMGCSDELTHGVLRATASFSRSRRRSSGR